MGTLAVSVNRGTATSNLITTNTITLTSTTATGPVGAQGPIGPAGPVYQMFTVPSTLNVGTGKARFYAPVAMTIGNISATVGTAPTGASIIVDVFKNGSTIFTTTGNRPTITVGSFSDSSNTPNTTSLAIGDYLTVGIVQIGSTISGSDLTVQISLQPI
jgi:hypothetical protein